jgi:hypothetical protein
MSPIMSLRHALCQALMDIDDPSIRDGIVSLIAKCDAVLYPAEKIT